MSEINVLLEKIKAYQPSFQETKVREAFSFAKKAHQGQFRNTGEPYFSHLYCTTLHLTELQADEDTICAALLHDTIEDAGVTYNEIKEGFGDTVAKLVHGVTKVSKVKYRHKMADRQIVSLRRMFISMADDVRVIIIRLADRLHNMQTLHGLRPDKQLRIAKETLEIYCPLANLLGIWHLRWQLEDLCFKYLYSTEYQKIDQFFGKYKKGSRAYMDKLKDILQKEINNNKVECLVEGRAKHYYSIFQKIQKQKRSLENVYDIFALRVIVDSPQDCYNVLGIIHSLWKPRMNRFKDYIAVPKSNSYQSLHTTVFGPGGRTVEIQIRTKKMHEEAEYGIAAHWFYKNQLSSDHLKKADWIVQLLKLQKTQKNNENFVENLKVDIFQDRIFVFTPKGEIKDLPSGATVLDFAYAIHSDIGNHFKEGIVNGTKAPANSPIRTGDTVEVKTGREISPDLSWLKHAKTSKASENIRAFLREETKENKIQVGEKLLRKILERKGRDTLEKFLQHKNFASTLRRLGLKNAHSLFESICEEKTDPLELIEKVYKKERLFPRLFLLKKDQRIQNKEATLVTIEISGSDQRGILGEIASTISRERVNIASFKVHALYETNKFYYLSRLEIPSFKVLENVFERLEEIEGVESVRQVLHPHGNFLSKIIFPFIFVILHFLLLQYLQAHTYLFYFSFLIPAFAFWSFNQFVDDETNFYLVKWESFALTLMGTLTGIFLGIWEIYFFNIPYNPFLIAFIILLQSPFILLKIGYYTHKYVSQIGRLGFLLVSRLKEKKYIEEKILHLDPNNKLYKNISIAYEKYLFSTYHKNYLEYNCWRDHFDKIHDQINILINEYDDTSDKIVALVGCGPEPGDRDFSPKFLNLLQKDELKKVVLIDFSKLTLVSAINNLVNKGVPISKIQAYQVDLTRGLSTYFTKILLNSQNNNYAKTIEQMNNDLENKKEQILQNQPNLLPIVDHFDLFISSMFATATLIPGLNKFTQKVKRDKQLSKQEKANLIERIDDFHSNYNSYIIELSTKEIIRLGKKEQRGLIISDTEKIYKGTKETRKTVAVSMENTCSNIPSVKDFQVYRWLWQDETDHYHVIHSLIIEANKTKKISK